MKSSYSDRKSRYLRAAFAAAALLFTAGGARAQEGEAAKPALPERHGSFTYKDPRRTVKVPARGWEIYLSGKLDRNRGPERDPKFNVSYPHQLIVRTVNLADENNPDKDRRFVIHYQKPGDEPLARRVGSVMARLYWLTQDYLGRGPGAEYTNVWLTHSGEAGAEEYQKNLYLFKIDEPRAPAEWVRELAHEWAHLTLPNAGPYTEPEKWANGYLGERLYMKWLLYDNGQSDLWGEPINGKAYYDNQIVPLRDSYLNAGPAAPQKEMRDKAGMDYFIGQMLALEAAHGVEFMKLLFNRFATPTPQNLGLYYTAALRDMKLVQIPIDPASFIPERSQVEAGEGNSGVVKVKKAAYWIFLPGGEWQIDVQGTLPEKTALTVEKLALKPTRPSLPEAMAWETSIITSNGMWRRLELSAPAGETMEIRHIRISRKDALGIASSASLSRPAPPATAPVPRIIRRPQGMASMPR